MTIGIALSGGGTRAAVFHLGVLLRLAHCDAYNQIERISTVSGGSLVTALIFTHKKDKPEWPTAEYFKSTTFNSLRALLTSKDLLSFNAIRKNISVFPHIFTQRSLVVSKLLQSSWGINGHLLDLPTKPHWTINTTCIETGKNWRFSRDLMGDYVFGRHKNPPYTIAMAAAASAAVPYALGSLTFKLPKSGWLETDPATGKPIKVKLPPTDSVRLWDGGAYENLGVETLYKPGRGTIDCDDVMVSDASGFVPSLENRKNLLEMLSGGLIMPRLFDISSDQIRGLRSRMFIEAIEDRKIKGCLMRMGNSSDLIFKKSGRDKPYSGNGRLSQEEATRAWQTDTHLKAFSTTEFDTIARHGFEVADATLISYRPEFAKESITWKSITSFD